jgi:hypothetical protein
MGTKRRMYLSNRRCILAQIAERRGREMTFSATVKRVIDLATAIRDYWEHELPKRHPDYPIIKAGEDDGPPPPEEEELRDLLLGLPRSDLYKLLSLMYFGRGDFDAIGLESTAQDLARAYPDRERVIRQVMAKGPLADYLEDGLGKLAVLGIDVDDLAVPTT